ncbi:MAG: CRTAC1 family protein [Phycisphaerales bacterium]|nr:CRTAC1 family protein [Phycisphaerales bacterium]
MPRLSAFTCSYRSLALATFLAGFLADTAWSAAPFLEEAQPRGLVYAMQDYPQIYGNPGFGCGFADLDNDHDPDIVIIGATSGLVGIFENDGSGRFTDRSTGNGIPILPAGSAFAAADYDADGDLDLYLTQFGDANVLVRNDGNFQFTDVTGTAGVCDNGAGEAASFGDYDGDGWLDLYLCNYNGNFPGTENINNKLYRNTGQGTFQDVSVAQGVDNAGNSFQAVWFDYDRDGDVDLYLSNDRGHLNGLPNQLWRNDGGQLVNVSAGSGADLGLFSMGVACGDFDGNGWPDLYCTNIGGYEDGFNPLFLNQGNGTFVEASAPAGVDQYITSWGSIFFDYDNDGHQDLYVNNMFQPNALFVSDGTFPCVEIAASVNVTASTQPSFGSAVADVDNDGDLDLLVNNLEGNVELFINYEGETRNWIKYRMIGRGNNLFAVGCNVDTRVGGTWQFREIIAGGNGYLGQNELIIHVGLDDATLIDEVVVTWPGGGTRTLTSLPVNQTYPLYPPERLGDSDADGDVDLDDVDDFVFVILGNDTNVDHVALSDMDGNSIVDGKDLQAFVQAMSP